MLQIFRAPSCIHPCEPRSSRGSRRQVVRNLRRSPSAQAPQQPLCTCLSGRARLDFLYRIARERHNSTKEKEARLAREYFSSSLLGLLLLDLLVFEGESDKQIFHLLVE